MKTTLQRFFEKVEYAEHNDDQCWYWTSSINKKGYGNFWLNGISEIAHRVSYELFRDRLNKDLQIDHLCRNRVCVNPWHLEQVTLQENINRGNTGINQRVKTHCPQGHEYSNDNTYVNPNGSRMCRTCMKNRPMKSTYLGVTKD